MNKAEVVSEALVRMLWSCVADRASCRCPAPVPGHAQDGSFSGCIPCQAMDALCGERWVDPDHARRLLTRIDAGEIDVANSPRDLPGDPGLFHEELHSLMKRRQESGELRLLNVGTDRDGEHHWRYRTASGQVFTLTLKIEERR